MPYYAYSRQTDINHRDRKSYFAADLAKMLEGLGVDKVLTVNNQVPQMEGFFEIPMLEVDANRLCHAYYKDHDLEDLVIVGANDKLFQKIVNIKEHFQTANNKKEIGIGFFARKPKSKTDFSYIGDDVQGKKVIIVDNIVDTATTLADCVERLHLMGSGDIYGFAVHGVLSGMATKRIDNSFLKELVMTNTIPTCIGQESERINHVSVGKMIAEAIAQNSFNKSIEQLKKEGLLK